MFTTAIIAFLLPCTVLATTSPKRGLIYIPSTKHPADDKIWLTPPSDLTWYYNYQSTPSPAFAGSNLQFVPQLWGTPSSDSDTAFLDSIRAQIKSGANISYVLGFNEPDASSGGGSAIPPDLAASNWNREIAPLRQLGVKLGAPAVTGAPSGLQWLKDFFAACKCEADFIPLHWYGSFEGLASHVGEVRAAWPDREIWVTEFALAGSGLVETEGFFNTSVEWFDRLE
jgi:Glycosyl hydrolase catalytic core